MSDNVQPQCCTIVSTTYGSMDMLMSRCCSPSLHSRSYLFCHRPSTDQAEADASGSKGFAFPPVVRTAFPVLSEGEDLQEVSLATLLVLTHTNDSPF